MKSSEHKNPQFRARLALLIGEDAPFAWAVRVGLNKSAFSVLWHEGGTPQRKTLERICAATGCSMEWLAHGVGEPFPGKVAAPKVDAQQEAEEPYQAEGFFLAMPDPAPGAEEMDKLDAERLRAFVTQVETDALEKGRGWDAKTRAAKVAELWHGNAKPLHEKPLAEVIEAIEEFLVEEDLDPPPHRKAVLITLLYLLYEVEGHIKKNYMQSFLRLVA